MAPRDRQNSRPQNPTRAQPSQAVTEASAPRRWGPYVMTESLGSDGGFLLHGYFVWAGDAGLSGSRGQTLAMPFALMGGRKDPSMEVSPSMLCSDLLWGYDASDSSDFQMARALHFPKALLFADETPTTMTSEDNENWRRLAIKLTGCGIYVSVFVLSFLHRRLRGII